jgi:outer membrane protein TolC
MRRRRYFWSVCFINLALALLVTPRRAHALEPLSAFLAGARATSPDMREAALARAQQESESLVALGRALPSLSARGVYTRNPSGATITVPGGPTLTIQAADQLDGYFQVDVPVVDFAAWARVRAANATEDGAGLKVATTLLDVQKQVARSYYQLIGAAALRQSAMRALAAAESNRSVTTFRKANGVATEIDVDRAAAEVERSRQSISDADLSAALARRALLTLTGVSAEGPVPAADDDLHEEGPLAGWESVRDQDLPAVAAAIAQTRSAQAIATAAKFAFLPTLTASAQERLTNAPGFLGKNSYFVVSATLSMKVDLSTYATMRSQIAAAEIASVREGRTRTSAKDQIHEAWHRVGTGLAKSRAARSESKAAARAVERARDRYAQGAGTQIELVQAERDAFSAEVARIQADADLSYARAALRLAAGKSLDPEVKQ